MHSKPTFIWYRATKPPPKGFSCAVAANRDGIVVRTAPSLKQFIGRKLVHLALWLRKQDGHLEKIEPD